MTVDATAGTTLDTFDNFQAFVKGLEADAAANRVRRARPPLSAAATPVTPLLVAPVTPPPAFLPQGPLFHDTPSSLLPLGPSGLRTARSFVLLFGLSAVALAFLAIRSRLTSRGAFVSAALDEHGDYVEFV